MPNNIAKANRELLEELIKTHNIKNNCELQKLSGVDNSTISRIRTGKDSWTDKTCDALNKYFTTNAFIPVRYSKVHDTYYKYGDETPRKKSKTTPNALYKEGDTIHIKSDNVTGVIDDIEYQAPYWYYSIKGKCEYYQESDIQLVNTEEHEHEFNVGQQVVYKGEKYYVDGYQYNPILDITFYVLKNYPYTVPETALSLAQIRPEQYVISTPNKDYIIGQDIFFIKDNMPNKGILLGILLDSYDLDNEPQFVIKNNDNELYELEESNVFNTSKELEEYLINQIRQNIKNLV